MLLSKWRDPVAWFLYVDLLAVLAAALLPWSTTGFAILLVLWLLALIPLIPTLDVGAFLRLLSRPICLLPLAIFVLAVVGTLWADVPWQARLHGIKPVAKLLVIPFLLYHFERSQRGSWVFAAFLASCALLMGLSWIVLFAPELKLTATKNAGVPVKNYIDQSQEFALCMVALAPLVITLYKQHRYVIAAACTALVLAFFTNMAFVVSARAALIYVPVLLIVFAIVHLDRRKSALLLVGIIVTATAIWFTSPYLRGRIKDIASEYQFYQENVPFSTGQRLKYWQKSVSFFVVAPIFGNGTGSIMQLFERDAVGQTGLAAEVTGNPHNQTLNVAVQWGMTGIAALYAMWLVHLFLFRGDGLANWIGLLVVVQNVVSSLFNSHLFDFHEGWMYVLGVGIAGGMSLRARQREAYRVPGHQDSGRSVRDDQRFSQN
ncbi:O-antigen ligase family protein [Bradyrhizobium sp.]|uniref:O-antigen ligase family protein n=1 Tax=Bradyrhizobium sp. TaxID=376 RepID=UPI0040377225